MKVTQIYIYPVKSLGGISLNNSQLSDRGLEFDRRWLLINEEGEVMTQRSYPSLVYFLTLIRKDGIGIVFSKDGSQCLIPFQTSSSKREKVSVWGDEFEMVEVSKAVSHWFSDKLGEQVRLMYQPDDSLRFIDPRYAVTDKDVVSTADGYPVLMISEASLEDLNGRLDEPVEMLRFRPNLVIDGIEAYAEDNLGSIKIGEAELIGVKNCGRCVMVTIDPKEATLGKEPLKTLSTYRKDGSKVLFGRNFLVGSNGAIQVGDSVELVTF
ncbi:MOSC domain-containing protein [Jiulongibacter sediminis]|uniref:MOSC domain-containing protein n=1 Tax=Jiulongibacter sediminis TaxID=1605367 RepID=A0A0N8HAF1_9BACT|nr:MOSC N-terminal beta barrel domain-containing protein [Jiulongibacter sediminis]KPM49996.1 hypothetical protein AFM12_05435 [Jiulongibacter sediminis]TBX27026.1 hypothetical protein TK44_05440 [Jiulongibacter sediminis]